MMTVGKAKVLLEGDLSKLNTALKKGEHSTKSWTSSIAKLFKRLFVVDIARLIGNFSNMITKMFGKVIRTVTGFVKKTILAGDELARLEIAFEAMLGSSEKAAKLTESISKFADKSPFETTEIENSAKSLLAFGFSMKEIIPLLTQAGNVSAMMGKRLEEVAYAFGMVKSGAGGLAMRSLRLMGISTKNLMEEGLSISKSGAILGTAEEMMDAVMKVINKKFGGGLEKFSLTFSGLVSTLKSKWDMFLKTIAKAGFLDVVNKQLIDIVALINKWGEEKKIQIWAEFISAKMTTVLEGIVKIGKAIGEMLSKLMGIKIGGTEEAGLDIVKLVEIEKAEKLNAKIKETKELLAQAESAGILTDIQDYTSKLFDLEAQLKEIPVATEEIAGGTWADSLVTKINALGNKDWSLFGKELGKDIVAGIVENFKKLESNVELMATMGALGVTIGKEILKGIGEGMEEAGESVAKGALTSFLGAISLGTSKEDFDKAFGFSQSSVTIQGER